jgi:hypothetical protein
MSSQLTGMMVGMGRPADAGRARDREPVREATHDAGLGDGQDEATPPSCAQRVRRHRQGDRRQQDEQGEPALAGRPPVFGTAVAVHARSLLWSFQPA